MKKKIVKYIKSHPFCDVIDVATELKFDIEETFRIISDLTKQGEIIRKELMTGIFYTDKN